MCLEALRKGFSRGEWVGVSRKLSSFLVVLRAVPEDFNLKWKLKLSHILLIMADCTVLSNKLTSMQIYMKIKCDFIFGINFSKFLFQS